MNTTRLKQLIDLLEFQIAMFENPLDTDKMNVYYERANQAVLAIVNEDDGVWEHELEHTDGTSRLTISLSLKTTVTLDEDIPDYLPKDIFARLKGISVADMIRLLQSYGMPEDEIKPFLRRILPADDVF